MPVTTDRGNHRGIQIRPILQPAALPSTSQSHQLRGCGWQPWTRHFPSLCFNYVWVPEGHREDRVQLVDRDRGRWVTSHAHMPESIRKSQMGSSAAGEEWKRSSKEGWGLEGWGWRMRGMWADEKQMTDTWPNVAKINKDTHHWLVCALITLKELLIWFSLYPPLFLSLLHVWSLLQPPSH